MARIRITWYLAPVPHSPLLGVRPSASDRLMCQIAGTRYLAPVFEKPAHGVCMMQDRKGSDPGYPVPDTHAPFSPFQILTKPYQLRKS